jgi:hypothetical protein
MAEHLPDVVERHARGGRGTAASGSAHAGSGVHRSPYATAAPGRQKNGVVFRGTRPRDHARGPFSQPAAPHGVLSADPGGAPPDEGVGIHARDRRGLEPRTDRRHPRPAEEAVLAGKLPRAEGSA